MFEKLRRLFFAVEDPHALRDGEALEFTVTIGHVQITARLVKGSKCTYRLHGQGDLGPASSVEGLDRARDVGARLERLFDA